jgi:hypothetical protein
MGLQASFQAVALANLACWSLCRWELEIDFPLREDG